MATILAGPLRAVIVRPSCSACGMRMSLVRIFPDKPGYDQRTYECPRCEHEVTEIVRFRNE
jgi:transposase